MTDAGASDSPRLHFGGLLSVAVSHVLMKAENPADTSSIGAEVWGFSDMRLRI